MLECQATGQSLHINNGDVEGTGGRDKKSAQFTVHVRRPAVVALQNVSNNDYWLGIMDDRLIGTVSVCGFCVILWHKVWPNRRHNLAFYISAEVGRSGLLQAN